MSFSIGKDGIFDPEGKYPNPLTGQPYSKSYKTLALGNKDLGIKGWSEYTAWKSRVDIIKKIHQHQILLLVLPTGVGKTVILPKLLLHYFGYKKRVVVTVPRLAVGAEAGEYAAKLLDVPLYEVYNSGKDISKDILDENQNKIRTNNKIVGYKFTSVGTQFGDKNSILLFTTDGNIKQTIVSGDKDLSNYGGIIIDEAHERSVNIDVLIALVMEIIPRRPDFRVIIMSATIDKKIFTDYFKRIGLGNKYGTFDLDKVPTNFKINYIPTLKNVKSSNLVEEVYKKINEIILDPKLKVGNILAFVTSESEIFKVKKKIDNNMAQYPSNNKPFTIGFPANIDSDLKDIAVGKKKAPVGFSCKVIIATNAVESSITFKDDLVYVIDSGLAFEKKYDARNYCYDTGKNLVSQASILQRCGRTGRNCNGDCIQLYTTEQFNKLSVYTTPKILVEEFTNELLNLTIINGNIPNALKFMNKMIEEPSNYKDIISRAYHNLLNMDLINSSGSVTNLGYVCSKFNDIKIGKMIIGGYYLGCMDWCIMLGAVITQCESYDKMFRKPPNMEDDYKIKQMYENNIKRFLHETGDHITLLNIFYKYISIPIEKDRRDYAMQNSLDYKILNKIQEEYSNLRNTIKQQIPLIKNLNLFDVPQELLIFGGGKLNEGDEYEKGKDMDEDLDDDDDGSDDDDSDDSDGSDDSDEYIFNENNYNMNNLVMSSNIINNIKNQNGGYKNSANANDDDEADDDDSDDDEDEYDSDSDKELDAELDSDIDDEIEAELDTKIDTNLYKTYNGGAIIKNTKNNNHYQNYQNNQKNQNNQNNQNIKKTKKIIGGGNTKENDIKNKKRLKILELIDIKNLQPMKINPSPNIISRILSCLFFGFSNNIACYSGNNTNYFVKFSPKQGSIQNTTFDFNKKIPDFIIYNEFSINKDMGNRGSKLSMVSEINSHHFGQFININELQKKIKNL